MRTLKIIFLSFMATSVLGQGFQTDTCEENGYNPLNKEMYDIMEQIVSRGVPGIVAAVESDGVLSLGSAGFAKIEDQTPMEICHLQYLGSIPKTYMATLIMKLYEEGKIDLNASVVNYLPQQIASYVDGMEKITVKMLLNHTSGLPEYNYVPSYLTLLLQYPKRVFSPEEMLKFIDGKELLFEPGSKFMYVNANFLLLSIIADQITGDHAKYMREQIFEPLGIFNTYYRIQAGNTYNNRLVNNYWDRYSDGILENSSVLLNSNTASMAGDDGIVTTPADAIKFLKGLMQGEILNPQSLSEMKKWVYGHDGNPTYGLGLDLSEFSGHVAMGHSGAGLGTGAQLFFFPEKNIYMFLAINLATVTESPIHEEIIPLLDKLYTAILSQ